MFQPSQVEQKMHIKSKFGQMIFCKCETYVMEVPPTKTVITDKDLLLFLSRRCDLN